VWSKKMMLRDRSSPEGRVRRWYLESLVEGGRQLRRIAVHPFPFRVGRNPGLSLTLSSDSVSKEHAELFLEDGQLCVFDLGSKNGTFVNGERIKQSRLREGDILHLGQVEYRVGRQDRVGREEAQRATKGPRKSTKIPPQHLNMGIENKDGTRKASRVLTTVADKQTTIELHVIRGEGETAGENKILAKFELTNIPPAPKGVPQIEVSVEIDVNGVYHTSARDQATGRQQSMTIHPSGGLSQAEVSRLVKETRAQEDEDRKRKDLEAVVRQLEGLVSNIQMSAKALKPKLTPDEQEQISQAVENATKLPNAGTKDEGAVDELKLCVRRTEEVATIIGTAMLRPSPDEPRIPTVCSGCGRDITETLHCPTCVPGEIKYCSNCGRLLSEDEWRGWGAVPDPRGDDLVVCADCCRNPHVCQGCGRDLPAPVGWCVGCREERKNR
jgi:pSer/pThr/pTyr-binding forkhead associated (FHA) protein